MSTAAPVRPTVNIDGELHELALMGDFGIVEQQALTRDGAEFQRLWSEPEELAENEALRLKLLLDRVFPRVHTMPKAVAAKLNEEDRARVMLAFMREPLRRALVEAAREEQAQQQIAEEILTWTASVADRELTDSETDELMRLLGRLIQAPTGTLTSGS